MTRKEIVERTITFNNPPRLAMKFDVVGVNDCYDVWTPDPTGWSWSFEGQLADEWGCTWQRTGVNNTGQVVGHPLADWSKLKGFTWPAPDDERRYQGFKEQLAGADDRFVMFCYGNGIWERLHMLHGMADSLMDFYAQPDEVHEVLDRALEHHLRVFHNCMEIAKGRVHAAAMADDWGMQDRPFIGPKLFAEFFAPRYKRWFGEMKAAGVYSWMHSCGHINQLLDQLIECGLEVVNSQQPNVVGIEEMGRRFAGRICFESIVDTQSTLVRGTIEQIQAEARKLLETWGTPKGGFIASDYNDAAAIGSTLEARRAMFAAFAEKGGYPGWQQILEQTAAGELVGHSWGRQAAE